MGNIKENYDLMFTAYPDIVNIVQLKEMLGIGVNLAYRLVTRLLSTSGNGFYLF